MGMGLIGLRCRKCRLSFNSYWNSVTWEFGGTDCPECGSDDTEKLPDSVKSWNRDEIPDYDTEPFGRLHPRPSWLPPIRGDVDD